MKTTKINNIDFTSFFTPTGSEVTYNKIDGGNGGVMQTGYTEDDILARKAVVTLTCMPLTESQQEQLLQEVAGTISPWLYYFDPKTRGYRSIPTICEITTTKHRGIGGTGVEYWTGLVLTFTEK